MRATILAGIYGACAVAVLTFYAVHQWLDPFLPLLIGVLGIALPCIVIVVALEEDTRPPNPNVMLLAETLLVAGIFGVALPGMWTVSDMRLKALSNFPSDRALESALDDEHENVRSTACRMMFDPRFEYDLQAATAALLDRPTLAVPCLREVPQVEAANEVTRKLTVLWHQTLLTGAAQDCEKAPALDSLMTTEATRASMLLDCSLRASSADVRQCCTDRAAVSYPGRKLLEQVKLARDNLQEMGTPGALVAASFGEDVFLSQIGSGPKQLRLQSPEYQQIASELACGTIAQNLEGGDDARSFMRWVFTENENCLPEELRESTTDVGAACDAFLEDDDHEDLGAALCRANLAVRKADKEEAAKVRAGVDLGGYAENIDAGRNHLKSNLMAVENYDKLVESGDAHDLTPQDRKMVQSAWAQRAREHRRKSAEQPSKGQVKRDANIAATPEGRRELTEKYKDGVKGLSDVERATGISPEEFMGGISEDGEVSDELQQKLDQLEQEQSE